MRALKSLRGKRLQRAKSLASDCFGARQPTDRLWPEIRLPSDARLRGRFFSRSSEHRALTPECWYLCTKGSPVALTPTHPTRH